ncbi:MAG: hypothetical protein JWM22_601, partial [Frankiales bacterium]|nr:hypothetical protein [Frankiales bacterium]
IDTTALQHETIYVSAGRRGADLGLAPADLVTITRGVTADIRAEAAPRSR